MKHSSYFHFRFVSYYREVKANRSESMTSNIAQMPDFEYINKDSINVELVCIICTKPFVDPCTLWICGHIFCRVCIEKVLTSSRGCPKCLTSISDNNFISESKTLVARLNQLMVRCEYCNEENIRRGNFSEHIQKLCPEVIVHCPASDSQCVWTGPRDQCNNHVAQCTVALRKCFHSQLESVMNQLTQLQRTIEQLTLREKNLLTENRQLKSQMDQFDQRCKSLESTKRELTSQVKAIEIWNTSLRAEIDTIVTENKHLDLQVFDLMNEKQSQQSQIDKLLSKNRDLEAQVKQLLEQNRDVQSRIQDLEPGIQRFEIQTDNLHSENQQLKDQVEHLQENNVILESKLEDLTAEKHQLELQYQNCNIEKERLESEMANSQQQRELLT